MNLTSSQRIAALSVAGLALAAAVCDPGRAQGISLPVPRITIYPRDIIRDSMLQDRVMDFLPQSGGGILDNREALIGKAARQTLLPGTPISASSVEEPRLVETGRQVRLVFQAGGISIVSSGQSLQAGLLGERVKARNLDSGTIVSGTVQADGAIRVGEE